MILILRDRYIYQCHQLYIFCAFSRLLANHVRSMFMNLRHFCFEGVKFVMSSFGFVSHVLSLGNCEIRITCPCNVFPLKLYFYIVKLGYAGAYIFLIFDPTHKLLVLDETATPVDQFFSNEFSFLHLKFVCIFHGLVFVKVVNEDGICHEAITTNYYQL